MKCEKIQLIRELTNLSPEIIAKNIGIDIKTWLLWEIGALSPSPSQMEKLISFIMKMHDNERYDPLKLMPNCFVQSSKNNYGIGKILSKTSSKAAVQYFHSVAEQEEMDVPLSSLKNVIPPSQTRCYFQDKDKGHWLMGRVHAKQGKKYSISLPDKKYIFLDEADMFIRSNRPIEDPLEILINLGQETPYFHDRRLQFYCWLIKQRATVRGMSGLVSSNLELYPHQVETVRRVSEDPIQRYLLSDEVGLGKTIEAGILLRQFLLDEEQEKALIITPPLLKRQWNQELNEKFKIWQFPNRTRLIDTDEILDIDVDDSYGLIIIDEAHHLANHAFSDDKSLLKRFKIINEIVLKTKRLLLLSATPALNNENAFLSMLHLLDPVVYKLDDISKFRERIAKRREIGNILLKLEETASNVPLKRAIKKLRDLFTDDSSIQEMAGELSGNLEKGDFSREECNRIIREIRTHISETYRIHRRMIRNRREKNKEIILGRFDEIHKKNIHIIPEYELDERVGKITDLLDEWRSAGLSEFTDSISEDHDILVIFKILFECSGTWYGLLESILECRLNGHHKNFLKHEIGKKQTQILCNTPFFKYEKEILKAMLDVIREESESGDRIYLLEEIIKNIWKIDGNQQSKIVVFTSFTSVCKEIIRRLSISQNELLQILGHYYGQTELESEESIHNFKINPECNILVVDSSGEEGRNFQFAHWLIHFDLPWSPNRIEQRIGRLDRIGRANSLRSRIITGYGSDYSLHEFWFKILLKGFGIFHDSIASLQFYVDMKLSQLLREIFIKGATEMTETIDQIKQEIVDEQIKIDEQDEIDAIPPLEKKEDDYFKVLKEFDDSHEKMRRYAENWIRNTLNFNIEYSRDNSGLFKYVPTETTLVPSNLILERLAPFMLSYGTYDRSVAVNHPESEIYRIGNCFIDAMEEFIRWDDRGQCFALWRVVKGWDSKDQANCFYFRFNYIIEADIGNYPEKLKQSGIRGINLSALKRKADSYFPPIITNVCIDIDGNYVKDPKILKILHSRYKKEGKFILKDYNLAKERLKFMEKIVDLNTWGQTCRFVQKSSENILRKSAKFNEICTHRINQASKEMETRSNQLRLRLNYLNPTNQRIEDNPELIIEEQLNNLILESIRKPHIRLDSVGFIVLSGSYLHFDMEDI